MFCMLTCAPTVLLRVRVLFAPDRRRQQLHVVWQRMLLDWLRRVPRMGRCNWTRFVFCARAPARPKRIASVGGCAAPSAHTLCSHMLSLCSALSPRFSQFPRVGFDSRAKHASSHRKLQLFLPHLLQLCHLARCTRIVARASRGTGQSQSIHGYLGCGCDRCGRGCSGCDHLCVRQVHEEAQGAVFDQQWGSGTEAGVPHGAAGVPGADCLCASAARSGLCADGIEGRCMRPATRGVDAAAVFRWRLPVASLTHQRIWARQIGFASIYALHGFQF